VLNLLKLSLLVFGGLSIFFGVEIILQGYLMFGDSFESRWGYLFLLLASVFIVIGGIIIYFFVGHKEDTYIQKYRDVYPTYESIFYSPAGSTEEKKVKEGEKEKIDVATKAKEEEKTPMELGYAQPSGGNVLAYSNPFYMMADNPELTEMGAVNPTSPYTAKGGEDKEKDLILPHPVWIAILFGVALVGGMMSFYVLTRFGFNGIIFMLVLVTFILAAILPSFVWLSFLSRLTRRNPIKMRTIYVVFTIGLLSVVPALIINTMFDYHSGRTFTITTSTLYSAFILIAIIAPFNEEFCKALGLVFLREDIETPLYGFIFGMTIGLGFSLVENVNYEFFVLVQSLEYIPPWTIAMDDNVHLSWGFLTFSRSVVGPIVHGLGVGLVGYSVAYAKERKKVVAYLAIPFAYFVAVFIHAFWNGGNVILSQYSTSLLALFNVYLVIMYLLFLMAVLYHLWMGKPLTHALRRFAKPDTRKEDFFKEDDDEEKPKKPGDSKDKTSKKKRSSTKKKPKSTKR